MEFSSRFYLKIVKTRDWLTQLLQCDCALKLTSLIMSIKLKHFMALFLKTVKYNSISPLHYILTITEHPTPNTQSA